MYLAKEEVILEWPNWVLARTKRLKGHKERLMLCFKDHVSSVDETVHCEAYMMLFNVGMKHSTTHDTGQYWNQPMQRSPSIGTESALT